MTMAINASKIDPAHAAVKVAAYDAQIKELRSKIKDLTEKRKPFAVAAKRRKSETTPADVTPTNDAGDGTI